MNLNQFISTYTGQAVDVDGVQADTGQCVQLVALYTQKVLGVALPDVVGAKDLWDNSVVQQNFDQIPIGQEQPGDIAVWGASDLINSPEYGHTDIVVSPGFTGFDSNWGGVKASNGYPAAHEVQHNYTDVLGFLRLKGANVNDKPDYNWIANASQIILGRKVPVTQAWFDSSAEKNMTKEQIYDEWSSSQEAKDFRFKAWDYDRLAASKALDKQSVENYINGHLT